MKTLTANEFINHGWNTKFPHTGPVAYGYGALPYAAALKGLELRSKNGRKRLFATAEAAEHAINEVVNKGA
jgi:hypothetical protein